MNAASGNYNLFFNKRTISNFLKNYSNALGEVKEGQGAGTVAFMALVTNILITS